MHLRSCHLTAVAVTVKNPPSHLSARVDVCVFQDRKTWHPVWTHHSPSVAVLRRLVFTARDSERALSTLLSLSPSDFAAVAPAALTTVFSANTSEFNATIRLRKSVLPQAHHHATGSVVSALVECGLLASSGGVGDGDDEEERCGASLAIPGDDTSFEDALVAVQPHVEFITVRRRANALPSLPVHPVLPCIPR